MLTTILITAAIIGGAGLVVYAGQARVVFMPRRTRVSAELVAITASDAGGEQVEVEGHDGTLLRGIFLPGEGEGPRSTILYFGGNAERLLRRIEDAGPLRAAGWNLVLVNYRGYGLSDGSPTSRHILADSLHIHTAMIARADVDTENIVCWGRSLGTGVAAHVAHHRGAVGLILTCPYTRLSDAGAHLYPWLPVRAIFRHEIDTLSLAGQLEAPVLIFHGDEDRVIPHAQAVRLSEAWAGPARLVTLPGRGHNDLGQDAVYFDEAVAFLGTLRPSGSGSSAEQTND